MTRATALFLILAGALAACGCGTGGRDQQVAEAIRAAGRESRPEANSRRDGHQRMLQQLAEIKDRVNEENPYLGETNLGLLREQLASLPPGSIPQTIQLMQLIGTREFQLGNLDQGIEVLREALAMAERAGDRIPPVALDGIEFTLGVAYLRYGEIKNCVENHNADSCLLPIRGKGVHVHPAGASNAIEQFESLLKRHPDHLATRWLLNIAHMAKGDYPSGVASSLLIPPEAFESAETFPRFVDRAAAVGLDTLSLAGGAIVDDFNQDGLLDVVVSDWNPGGQLRFFRNQGDGGFADQTKAAGLLGIFGGLNLVQADYDNDGLLDILVLRGGWLADSGFHPNSLLRNMGGGQFRDVTFEAGLGEQHFPTQTASWADYDLDGDLDLYIGNEKYPNQLFQNQGDGRFRDVAAAAGVDDGGYCKGVIWGDYDNDRHPDLYVSNMDGPNRLFRNLGDGGFEELAQQLKVAGPKISFPTWFWDYNNDGNLDLFVASFWQDVSFVAADYLGLPQPSEADCLYQGDGQGGFRDVARERGLTRVTQPMGSNFGDLDNDGFLDFYLGTGYPEYEALMPNLMFRNQAGERFVDVTTAGGFGHLQKGHGVAFADLDNDGDQDIFAEIGGWYRGDGYANALFENPGFSNHWLAIELVGSNSNRSAIGTRIRVEIEHDEDVRSIYRWVGSGGSFGGNPLRQHIGLGETATVSRLEVFWPRTGKTQLFEDVEADRFYRLTENEDRLVPLQLNSFTLPQRPPLEHHHQH